MGLTPVYPLHHTWKESLSTKAAGSSKHFPKPNTGLKKQTVLTVRMSECKLNHHKLELFMTFRCTVSIPVSSSLSTSLQPTSLVSLLTPNLPLYSRYFIPRKSEFSNHFHRIKSRCRQGWFFLKTEKRRLPFLLSHL